MQLRPPAIPLITIDPYFSVWSQTDVLTDSQTIHWTCAHNTILGLAEIDGKTYRFMGKTESDNIPALNQTYRDCDATSTYYTFESDSVILRLTFTSPVLPDDYELLTRPVSYLRTEVESADGKSHDVKVKICVSEEICLNNKGDDDVVVETLTGDGFTAVKMGSVNQPVLARSGDNIRIDWGYFYLAVGSGNVSSEKIGDMTFVSAETDLSTDCENSALFMFSYDDIYSIDYFGDKLRSYWNRNGKTIVQAIGEAYADYNDTMRKCSAFSDRLFLDATRAGGEKYAEICELSYRQAIASQKLVIDNDRKVLFISKECFSNGCAVTVDVSYPAIPLYLIYNPELVRGMLIPIAKYARQEEWIFDFAPHDAGQYPIVTGQVYNVDRGGEKPVLKEKGQMPVEECGNMIIMAAAALIADGDTSFVEENLDLLEKWVKYLETHGYDPENQLCTDDFAGHLAHNCNLTLKAIMGIAGLGIIYKILGREDDCENMLAKAKDMAESWAKRAANGDGSYKLAFDRPGSWSMKYNIVWDKLFGTEIMNKAVTATEFASYKHHINAYFNDPATTEIYTKSDWLIWTATLAERRSDFEEYVAPLWAAYNSSPSRVPMTDWYYTTTSIHRHFQHRSVVGGHFIKLLEYYGIMKNWKN